MKMPLQNVPVNHEVSPSSEALTKNPREGEREKKIEREREEGEKRAEEIEIWVRDVESCWRAQCPLCQTSQSPRSHPRRS